MPDEKEKIQLFTKATLISSIVVFSFLLILTFILIITFTSLYAPTSNRNSQVTIIAYNTQTPTPLTYGSQYVPTATPNLLVNKFSKGLKVKVQGTGGEGLRIHQAAGQDSPTIYLANDGDLFSIADGPVISGGLVWWKIKSLSPGEVTGWAAEDFLQIEISTP
jgi:hypothetical protein